MKIDEKISLMCKSDKNLFIYHQFSPLRQRGKPEASMPYGPRL